MDEYIFGRLTKEEKESFEDHVAKCDGCFNAYKEHKRLVLALIPVIKEVGSKKKNC